MAADITPFLKGLEAGRQRAVAAALKAFDQFGEQVLGDAQQLCPVDTGALQASGTTEPAKMVGDEVDKTIGFNTSYAAAVHENLTAHHDHGQAKYLSTAIATNVPKLGPFVAAAIKSAMGG